MAYIRTTYLIGAMATLNSDRSAIVGIAIRDTSAAFDITFAATSSTTLTAGRTLTFDVTNANRTLKFTGNPTLDDWFDQAVKTTSSPMFGSKVTVQGVPSSSVAGVQISPPSVLECVSSGGSVTTTQTHWSWINGNGVVGSITTNGLITTYGTTSDARLKSPLRPWSLGNKFDQIPIGEFTWKKSGEVGHGTLAQELYKIFPDVVTVGGDDPDTNPWVVDYGKLTIPLIAEVKALRRRILILESQSDKNRA